MRILILTHFYPPEMGGASARLHGLARWLVNSGNQVTVITGFPNYPSGVVLKEYRGRRRMSETIDGVEVIRTWVYASPHRKTSKRLANYFSFVASSIVTGLTTKRSFDLIFASSPPLFIGLSGLALARLHHLPLLFDIRDLWPQVAIDAGELNPSSLTVRLMNRLATFLYRQADHITPVTETKRQRLIALGVPAKKLTVVTNGVDLDRVTPSQTINKRTELGLEGKFVVLYAGLIGIAQGVEIMADAAERLRAHADIHFLIVGDGIRKAALEEHIIQRELSNVTLLPRQPREVIPDFLAAADVSLVPLLNSGLEDAVPSKMLEAWANQRAVILAAAGEAAAVMNRCNGGLVVAPEAPHQLDEAILALRDDRKQLETFAQNGHEFVKNYFDRRALALQLEQVLQGLVIAQKPEGQVGKPVQTL